MRTRAKALGPALVVVTSLWRVRGRGARPWLADKTLAVWGGLLLLACYLASCATAPRGAVVSTPTHPRLRVELLEMEGADQAARRAWLEEQSALRMSNVVTLDQRHTARMKTIVRDHGWPGASMVGKDGAHAAWLLVQHATQDLEFMKRCLCLMEQAVCRGEASAADAAYLLDRVRVQEGKPQVYGTQFRDAPGGKMEAYPIENPSKLDWRRRRAGLPPMRAYESEIRSMYQPNR